MKSKEVDFLSQIWILISATVIAFFLTVNDTSGEISYEDIANISKLGVGILFLQIIVVLLCQIFINLPINKYLFAVFIVANFYSFHIVFLNDFATQSLSVQIILFSITIFIAFQFLASVGQFKKWRLWINVISTCSVLVLGFKFYKSLDSEDEIVLPDKAKRIAASNIKMVDFVKKPNIYLLGFDALLNPSSLVATMGIDPIQYKTLMQQHQFRRFRNSFSDGVQTHQTLNRMLALHPEYYDALAEDEHNLERSLFPGVVPAPVLDIFHHNGYITTTYSKDTYFARQSGIHTNHLISQDTTLCFNHIPKIAINFGFFGYCHRQLKQKFTDFLSTQNTSLQQQFNSQDNLDETHNKIKKLYEQMPYYVDFILEDWDKKRKLGKPLLFMPYILSPGHAHNDSRGTQSDLDRYKKKLLDKITNETPAIIDKFVSDIKENDPNSIIIVYGDHGTHVLNYLMSKSVGGFMATNQPLKNLTIWTSMTAASEIYPGDFCPEYLSQNPGTPMEVYAVHSMLVRQLIRCLAGGEDPIIGQVDYKIYFHTGSRFGRVQYQDKMYPNDQPGRYEDYLYEFPNRMTNIVLPVFPE